MRLFTRLTLAGALALGLTVAACGDDGSSSGGTATAGTTAGETTEGGTTETATTESGTTEGDTTEGGTTEAGTTAGETTEGGTTEGGTTAGETTEGGTTEAGTTEGGTTGMANMCDPGSSMDGAECALPTEFPGDLVHMTEMSFLKDPSQYNCDANGDGAIDKNDGSLNDFLTGDLLSAFADVNATFADSILDGTLIFLVQMEGYKTGNQNKFN